MIKRLKRSLSKLIGRKHHIDFIVAILSIPVLLTVIVTNVMNLQNKSKTGPTPTPGVQKVIIQAPTTAPAKAQIVKTIPVANCKKEVGPISISFPEERETVNENPVCITIKYEDPNYCSVVWSYRINNSAWSDYSSNSVCLYNLPKGNIKFDLRAQSTVSQDQKSISRSFEYQGSSDNIATSSAR